MFPLRSGPRLIPERSNDPVEVALEACCASLVTLESVRLRARRAKLDADAVDRELEAAAQSLREAIEQLRVSSALGPSMVALGFVVEAVCT